MTPLNIPTEPKLLAALKKSAVMCLMTPEQNRLQKISFIMGSRSGNSKITRESVEKYIDRLHNQKVSEMT